MKNNNFISVLFTIWLISFLILTGCATTMTVVDVAGSTAIYAGKTVINTIDAITPNIVNK
jgi:uncharacterized lipoprotein YajG